MRKGIAVAAVLVVACTPLLGLDEPVLVELGAICTGSNGGDVTLCPPNAPACATLDGTVAWCTTGCGTGPPGSSPVPPPGGDLICKTLASSGTPACGLADVSNPALVTWYCEILCGTAGSQSYGGCPPGLTCVGNVCQ